MPAEDPNVQFVHTHDIEERSDVDKHAKVTDSDLGDEDWGDGFVVDAEPVVVLRGKDGGIVRTVPLSEHMERMSEVQEAQPEPLTAEPVVTPTPLSRKDRDKLVAILAGRLFKWYAEQPRRPDKYNPVYDGIPKLPTGSDRNLQPLPGTDLYPATPYQVLEWLKVDVIGPRVQIQNKKRGFDGYRPSLTIKRN